MDSQPLPHEPCRRCRVLILPEYLIDGYCQHCDLYYGKENHPRISPN